MRLLPMGRQGVVGMKTKPRGIHANFTTTCTCGRELTITNGRVDPHDCREPERPVTLEQIRAALERKAP